MKRIIHPLLLAMLAASSGAGAQSFSKEAMLRTLAQQTIIPAYTNFAAKATALAGAAEQFSAAPSTNLLADARRACAEAIVAWKATVCAAGGPATDLDLVSKFGFWPTRTQNIELFLRGGEPVTFEAVAEQGVATTSLFAIEYLLWSRVTRAGTREDPEALLKAFAGEAGERRRKFLAATTRVAADRAKRLAEAWLPEGGNYAEKLAKSGQDSVNLLVNNTVASVELVVEKRFKNVIELNPPAAPQDLVWIEGAPSGVSLRGQIEVLRSARALLAGLSPQLRSAGSPVGERLRAQFEQTIITAESVGGPIESVLPTKKQAVSTAFEQGKKLEILLKTELASALGVTLTFNTGDGD